LLTQVQRNTLFSAVRDLTIPDLVKQHTSGSPARGNQQQRRFSYGPWGWWRRGMVAAHLVNRGVNACGLMANDGIRAAIAAGEVKALRRMRQAGYG
jgi:hypothetical protein